MFNLSATTPKQLIVVSTLVHAIADNKMTKNLLKYDNKLEVDWLTLTARSRAPNKNPTQIIKMQFKILNVNSELAYVEFIAKRSFVAIPK